MILGVMHHAEVHAQAIPIRNPDHKRCQKARSVLGLTGGPDISIITYMQALSERRMEWF